MTVTESPAWKLLKCHYEQKGQNLKLNDLFKENPNRFQEFSRIYQPKSKENSQVLVDFSKNLINSETFELMMNLAKESKVEEWRNKMFQGKSHSGSSNQSQGKKSILPKVDQFFM